MPSIRFGMGMPIAWLMNLQQERAPPNRGANGQEWRVSQAIPAGGNDKVMGMPMGRFVIF